MAILDKIEELCETVLDPSYCLDKKSVEQAKKIALLAKEWRQTGCKPKGFFHEVLILHNLGYEQAMRELDKLREIYGD